MPAPLTDSGLSQALYGDPVLLGTIVSAGSSTTNGSTAVPFNNTGDNADGGGLRGKTLLIQSDVAIYVKQVTTSASTVTSANGVKISADQLFYISMRREKGFLAIIPVSGSANVKVFEMNG